MGLAHGNYRLTHCQKGKSEPALYKKRNQTGLLNSVWTVIMFIILRRQLIWWKAQDFWFGKFCQNEEWISNEFQPKKFYHQKGPLTFITIYAHEQAATVQEKNDFYDSLTPISDRQHQRLFILGDFNPHIENDSTKWRNTISKYNLPHQNTNGDRMLWSPMFENNDSLFLP